MTAESEMKLLIKKAAVAKQQALRLVSSKSFRNRASNIRKEFGIPEKGIPLVMSKGSNDVTPVQRWQHELWEKSDDWTRENWPQWKKRIAKTQNKGDETGAQEIQNQFNQLIPLNRFHGQIKELMSAYELSPRWSDGVKWYVLTNDLDALRPMLVMSAQSRETKDGKRELSIPIDKDFRWTDLELIKPMVDALRQELPGEVHKRFRPSKRLDHVYYATKLRLSGTRSHQALADAINSQFGLSDENAYAAGEISDLLRIARAK